MRDWVSTVQFRCGACGGVVPRYVWYEKEAFKQQCLFPEEECHCDWKVRLETQLDACFNPSRVEGLERFRRLMGRHGIPFEASNLGPRP